MSSSDQPIADHIEQLVAEEHRLYDSAGPEGLSPADEARLERVRVELDRSWDLLRQRRARREFGEDPDQAHERDARTVEDYWQ